MDFCICGSMIVRGNCTNRKCNQHYKSLAEEVTHSQIEYIKSLCKRLDETEPDYEVISKREASSLIERLLEKTEIGG